MADWLILLGSVAMALTAIGVVLNYLVVRPLRKWIVQQARAADKLAKDFEKQVTPNGGNQDTTRHLIETIHEQVGSLSSDIVDLKVTAQQNRDMANAALALASQVSERLDRHLEHARTPQTTNGSFSPEEP